MTQGTLLRLLIREGQTAKNAQTVLRGLAEDSRHEFWPDAAPYTEVDLRGVIGHRQVTDAYLAALARSRGARLATFDRGLAELHRDVADVVPVAGC